LADKIKIIEARAGNWVLIFAITGTIPNTSKNKLLVKLLKEYLISTTELQLPVSNPEYHFPATKNYISLYNNRQAIPLFGI
jgi:hypothetical protein